MTSGETTFIFAGTQRSVGFEFSTTTRFHNLPATTTPNTNVFAVNLFVPNANPPPALLRVPDPVPPFPLVRLPARQTDRMRRSTPSSRLAPCAECLPG